MAGQAAMDFDTDIFVSYAHLDNESPLEGQPGWVSNFHHAVEKRVGQLLGRRPSIWRDPKLTGIDVFEETISEKLREVAVLVCVLSPRYVRSEWCTQELKEFWEVSQKKGGVRIAGKVRVFKVVKTRIPLNQHPAELQKCLGYEFFTEDPETGRVRELNPTFDPEALKSYLAKLDDLAYDISQLLEKMEAGTGESPGEGEAPTSEKGIIYLAETTFDLKEERDAIKRDLQRHGYTVLPDQPLPLVASDFEAFVRDQLAKCRLSIHLVGKSYGIVPEAATKSVVALQNELAIERGAADFSRLIWIPPNLQVADERQQSFIEHLRTDARIQHGADILETPLEDFKAEIHQKLNPPERSVSGRVGKDAGEADLTRIYLICDQRDLEKTRPLEDYLFDQGFEVILPVFEGDEAEVSLDHEENLRTCDAVLIFYGQGNELWLRRKLGEVQKSWGYGRSKPMLAKGIFVAPPESPRKAGYRTHEARVIHQGESFAPASLEPFLTQIKQEKAKRVG